MLCILREKREYKMSIIETAIGLFYTVLAQCVLVPVLGDIIETITGELGRFA